MVVFRVLFRSPGQSPLLTWDAFPKISDLHGDVPLPRLKVVQVGSHAFELRPHVVREGLFILRECHNQLSKVIVGHDPWCRPVLVPWRSIAGLTGLLIALIVVVDLLFFIVCGGLSLL